MRGCRGDFGDISEIRLQDGEGDRAEDGERKRRMHSALSGTCCSFNRLPDNIWSLIKYANNVLSGDKGNREINPETMHENKKIKMREWVEGFLFLIKLFQKIKLKQN